MARMSVPDVLKIFLPEIHMEGLVLV